MLGHIASIIAIGGLWLIMPGRVLRYPLADLVLMEAILLLSGDGQKPRCFLANARYLM